MSQKELNSDYVKDLYNDFLASPEQDYTYNRWQKTPLNVCQYRQTKRVILSLLGSRKYGQALEIGGGDGVWTKLIMANLEQMDFVDISKEMLARAKSKLSQYSQIIYYQGDFLQSNLPANYYDVGFLFRVFEYFNDKNVALRTLNSLLKLNGEIFIITKSPAYDWKCHYQKKVFHSGQLRIASLLKLLQEHGFEIIKVKPAILGKLLKWPIARWFFSQVQSFNCFLPFNLLPLSVLQYVSESFIIRARKIK